MAQHTILVVEDEHTLRRLLEYRLGKHYRVLTASNGLEALERIEADLPDLIISDIMMPHMDGFALQAALQERKETRAIPFIFLTAKADEQSRMRGMRTGVDDYITKPFDIEQLLVRVERLLERTSLYQSQLGARLGQTFSQQLMPKNVPKVTGYRSFYSYKPREHGGGDFFDWIAPRPGLYFLTVGDVMGKGVEAKLFAFGYLAYLRSTLHALLPQTQSPAELMTQMNQVLLDDPPMEDTFASLLLMRWEPEKHLITYTNAGHCHPILITSEGTNIIENSDLVIGLNRSVRYQEQTIELPAGSALLSYTDGLIEQRLKTGEMLGEEGLARLLPPLLQGSDPIPALLEAILRESESPDFTDDILVFWLERERASAPPVRGPRWFSPFLDASEARS